jgi:hypothetical protein
MKSKEKKLLRSSGSCHLAPPTSEPNKRNWESISSRERYSSLTRSSAVKKGGASSTTAEQSRSEDARRAEEERHTEGKQHRILRPLKSSGLPGRADDRVDYSNPMNPSNQVMVQNVWLRGFVYLPLHLPDLHFLVNQRAERERGEELWRVPIPFRLFWVSHGESDTRFPWT